MIPFDPSDPFPLLPPGLHSYSEAQEHSARVDAWLGLEVQRTEDELRSRGNRKEFWIGLPSEALLTPYTEFREILEKLLLGSRTSGTVIDLGAGYGRMGFVVARHYPGIRFIGYESVAVRAIEGQRCLELAGCGAVATIVQADLMDIGTVLEPAEFYFIYDYGAREAIEKTLVDLREIASRRSIVVVGRGRAVRDAIERRNPWLSQVREPEHCGGYSIYRS